MGKQRLIQAHETIRIHCKSNHYNCSKCLFRDKEKAICTVGEPHKWKDRQREVQT